MRNKHKKEEICDSLVWWGRIIGQSTDNHSRAELGLIIRSRLRRCQGSENKSSQKPTKNDTFLCCGKDLVSEATNNDHCLLKGSNSAICTVMKA
jgi:hypothetical protein